MQENIIGTKFGPFSQLEVIDFHKDENTTTNKYIVECSICKQDPELFGDGRFLISKNKIKAGRIPCGCYKRHSWTQKEWLVRIKRECNKRGYKLICSIGKISRTSKIYLESPFGEVDIVSVNNFITGQDTNSIRKLKVGEKNSKPVEQHIENFMKTGAFAQGTTFQRNQDKLDKYGFKVFWTIKCGNCHEVYESQLSNIYSGKVGCSCSQRRHNKSYIHLIFDEDGEELALKFGITSIENRRIKEQSKRSGLDLRECGVWQYDTVSACRRAEVEVKRLYNNFLTKDTFPDGYTETAPITAKDTIIKIYEENGGVLIK